MKLNKQRWIEEVRRVEADIKSYKAVMRTPDYQRLFSYQSLFALKAEATRLYTLRRVMKGKSVELKTFHYLMASRDSKHIWCYGKDASKLTYEQVLALILDGVPSWKASFLQSESEAPAPSQAAVG